MKNFADQMNLYDAYGVLDYNWPNAEPGKGSAIFIHAWRSLAIQQKDV
jgi:L,D-peptidoglycan transpeptidase YkuD (ErfK/YbiS/YcfS/YnhG family)